MNEKRVIDQYIGNTSKIKEKNPTTIFLQVQEVIKCIQNKSHYTKHLAHINYQLPFCLFVDASFQSTGAAFFQPASIETFNVAKPFKSTLHCVALYSKKHEYKVIPFIIALELKAISDSLTFFGELVATCPIHIYTDHKSLLTIIRESTSFFMVNTYGVY